MSSYCFPSLLAALLLVAAPVAQAQTGAALETNQDEIRQSIQNCLEGTGGDAVSDSSQARKCSADYYERCADGGGDTAATQRQCWGALESYWASVVAQSAQRIEAAAPAKLKRYVEESGREEERYRKERCRFYQYLEGPWAGPAEARCLTETLIDRAVDLEVIQQNMPR